MGNKNFGNSKDRPDIPPLQTEKGIWKDDKRWKICGGN